MDNKKIKITKDMVAQEQIPISVTIDLIFQISEDYSIQELEEQNFDKEDFLYYISEDLVNHILDLGKDEIANYISLIQFPKWENIFAT